MAVPNGRLTNADLERTLDTTDEWIRQRTGIRERRIASAGESTATLAASAGAEAIKDAGVTPDDLDLVVVATCTPDMPVPGSSPFVQAELGAGRAGVLDVNAGCSGFVYALSMAAALVEVGRAGHVLVCGAETLSRITDPAERGTAVLFGDGAGAVVVGPDDASRIGPFVFGADGARADWLCVPAGGSRRPADADTVAEGAHTVRMRGQDVYKHATDRMTEASLAVMDRAGPVDLVVAHQANGRILETVAERLGLRPEQLVVNVDRYGNTSAASIPVALAELADGGRVCHDDRVLLVTFGAGFCWAAGLVRWGRS